MKLPWKEITRLKKPQLTEIAIAKGLEPTWYLAPECLTKRGYYNHFKACKYVNEFEPKVIAKVVPDEVLVPDEEVIEVTEQEYEILTGLVNCYERAKRIRKGIEKDISTLKEMSETTADSLLKAEQIAKDYGVYDEWVEYSKK